MIKKAILFFTLFSFSFAFYVGVGDFMACKGKYGSEFYTKCPYDKRMLLYKFLKKEVPNVNAVSMWITRDWNASWYPAKDIEKFIKHGYTPIFIFYWFGDDISPQFVKTHKRDYFNALTKFALFLRKIKGKKIVILNPEYNENGMTSSKSFDILQAKSILLIKKYDSDTLVGICPGDFGDYNVTWDSYNWNLLKPSMKYSAKLSDFIAFQEMRAITQDTKEQIENTALRTLAFATYLHQTYRKPTFLAYIAVSSYRDLKIQTLVFKRLAKITPLLKRCADMIGLNLFNYIDNPNHKGYFKKAETSFGIKYSDGKPKPAFFYFRKIK